MNTKARIAAIALVISLTCSNRAEAQLIVNGRVVAPVLTQRVTQITNNAVQVAQRARRRVGRTHPSYSSSSQRATYQGSTNSGRYQRSRPYYSSNQRQAKSYPGTRQTGQGNSATAKTNKNVRYPHSPYAENVRSTRDRDAIPTPPSSQGTAQGRWGTGRTYAGRSSTPTTAPVKRPETSKRATGSSDSVADEQQNSSRYQTRFTSVLSRTPDSNAVDASTPAHTSRTPVGSSGLHSVLVKFTSYVGR